MNNRLIRPSALVLGAVLFSAIAVVAEEETELEPANPSPTTACHAFIDPGFIATIEDVSNDTGFVTTAIDISNDTGFLEVEPVDPRADGNMPSPCPSLVPLPVTDVEP